MVRVGEAVGSAMVQFLSVVEGPVGLDIGRVETLKIVTTCKNTSGKIPVVRVLRIRKSAATTHPGFIYMPLAFNPMQMPIGML